MTLLFLKRLNDTFEENADNLIKHGKSENRKFQIMFAERRRFQEHKETRSGGRVECAG